MLVRKCTREDIEEAAIRAKVKLNEFRTQGRGFRFTLRPIPVAGDPKQKHWQRLNHQLIRRVHAVCWHGHREFMRELYALAPDTVIITTFARYEGSAHFEATHAGTRHHQIGSQMEPCSIGDACECDTNG